MHVRMTWTIAAGVLAIAASAHLIGLTRSAGAQTSRGETWSQRTLWGDPDLQGKWTSEGEYGVPLERPPQFGTRQFLTDEEYAKRLEDVRLRDERDLARVDVLSGHANMRIVQSPSYIVITYELIHDTRMIRLDSSPQRNSPLSPAIRMYLGDARGHWDGPTLVVEASNLKAATRGASPGLRLVERFTRTGTDSIQYQVSFIDPATWTAPWTAALDLRARPEDTGVFEYACHEGNYGMFHMLSASRLLDRPTP